MPLDQMHSANPPSHPELLAWLARDMATHGYDLRRLIRGLVMSDAYARELTLGRRTRRPGRRFSPSPWSGPLTPTQLATSLRLATADPMSLPSDLPADRLEKQIESVEASARSLAASFTNPSGDPQIGVAEALLFSNGKKIAATCWPTGPIGWSAASSRRRHRPR